MPAVSAASKLRDGTRVTNIPSRQHGASPLVAMTIKVYDFRTDFETRTLGFPNPGKGFRPFWLPRGMVIAHRMSFSYTFVQICTDSYN